MYSYEILLFMAQLIAIVVIEVRVRKGLDAGGIYVGIVIVSFFALIISVGVNGSMIERCPANPALSRDANAYC